MFIKRRKIFNQDFKYNGMFWFYSKNSDIEI